MAVARKCVLGASPLVPNGKKCRDWTIRSGIPNLAMIRVWYLFRERKGVGLSELITRNEGLRYVPAPSES